MTTSLWPLTSLRLQTPRLELRLPTESELFELCELAGAGQYDPSVPFLAVRGDTPVERARRTARFHWTTLGSWTAAQWSLNLAVFLDGRPVGWQHLRASDYATRREVVTGSWLRPDHRGDGIGTEMRTAVLHLAFTYLEARYATSRATSDNRASLGVSKKLGYEEDGMDVESAGEEVLVLCRVRLSADRWLASDAGRSVTVDSYEQCRELFGPVDWKAGRDPEISPREDGHRRAH